MIPCFHQPQPLLEPRDLSALNRFASIWCCIENLLIAAAAEGIQGVTRIPFAEESSHLKSVLEIPADYEVPCYLALGYPQKEAATFAPLAVKLEDRLHWNRW